MFERPAENYGRLWRIGWSVAAPRRHSRRAFSLRPRRPGPGVPRRNAAEHADRIVLSCRAERQLRLLSPCANRRRQSPRQPGFRCRSTPTQAPVAEISTSSPGAADAPSNDALGTDDIRIALTTYSPSPKPDLSHLPRGAQGDVVLDVTIDPTGQVADLQILADTRVWCRRHSSGYSAHLEV